MYRDRDDNEYFVVDSHLHWWDGSPENQKNPYGAGCISCFYDYHSGLSPAEYVWPREKYEKYDQETMVKDLFVDCDRDTILVKAQPTGPTCHTGERACFFSKLNEGPSNMQKSSEAHGGILESVLRIIAARKALPQPGSYTTKLFEAGQDKILKKVAEEAGEVLLAAKGGKREEIIYEVADLLFHTLMVLGYHDLSLHEVYQELGTRYGKSGLRQST